MRRIVFKALVWKRLIFFYHYSVRMILKATLQKLSSKQSLSKVSNCPEIHCRTLDSNLLSNDEVSISFPIRSSIKLVIINMTYTCMESYVKAANKNAKFMFLKTERLLLSYVWFLKVTVQKKFFLRFTK